MNLRQWYGFGFATWAAATLFACSRPEPSESNVGRLRSTTAGAAVASSEPAPSAPITAQKGVPPLSKSMTDQADPTATAEAPEVAQKDPLGAILARARRGGKSGVKYEVPPASELLGYRNFVQALAMGAFTSSIVSESPPDGFELTRASATYVALVERVDRRRGAAALVVRLGAASPTVIEVPHSFFDESTLPIGLALFEATRARALVVNTVHRYRSVGGKKPESATSDDDARAAVSDVAHAHESYFTAAHEALLRALPEGQSIQLHGYGDATARGFDVVLSAANTPAAPAPVAARLRDALQIRVALYPTDLRKLGGTTNAQARVSRQQRHPFLHVELAQSLRHRLVRDEEALRRFATAFVLEAH